ncbi:MAG: hypothetical protein M3042_05390 [Actinomycetota bacterium]|nr:hypothetical protein [Actinomycetota bacterium]
MIKSAASVKGIALIAATSVISAGIIVVGIREVRIATDHTYRETRVSISLPGALAAPRQVTIGLHASRVAGAGANVRLRTGAAGLVTVTNTRGAPAGLTLVTDDPILKREPVRVDYASTAATLALESPLLLTASPLLSSLERTEARKSPAVADLAALLALEATADPAFLSDPSAELISATRAAADDVALRVRVALGGPHGGPRSDAAPPGPPTPSSAPGPSGTASPDRSVAPAGPPGPYFSAPRDTRTIVLEDTNRISACATHAVAEALCLRHSDPSTASKAALFATNWTGGWQALFLNYQAGQFSYPVSIMPPVRNAPPTILGLVQTVVSAGIDQLVQKYCRDNASQLTVACKEDATPPQSLKSRLLEQLTLFDPGTDREDAIPLDEQLRQGRLTAIGVGVVAPTILDVPTAVVEDIALLLTAVGQVVVPLIELILDTRALRKEVKENGSQFRHFGGPLERRAALVLGQKRVDALRGEVAAARRIPLPPKPTRSVEAHLAQLKRDLAKAKNHNASRAQISRLQADLNKYEATQTAPLLRARADAEAHLAALEGRLAREQAALDAQWQKLAEAEAGAKLAEKQRAWVALVGYVSGVLPVFANVGRALASGHTADAIAQVLQLLPDALKTLLPTLVRLLFPGLLTAEGFAAFAEGQAIGLLASAIPVVDVVYGAARIFDLVSSAFGVAQNLVDLAHTIGGVPYRHDFPQIATNKAHGSRQVPGLRVFAADFGKVTQIFSDHYLAVTTTVCENTVIVPQAAMTNRHALIANFSDAKDLHFAAGGGETQHTVTLQGIEFALVRSALPLGGGSASFADPPPKGSIVRVASEGSGLRTAAFTGTVTDVVYDANKSPLAMQVEPVSHSLSDTPKPVGGLVYLDSGPAAGELVGLAQVEYQGKLAVLLGGGVEALTTGYCNE